MEPYATFLMLFLFNRRRLEPLPFHGGLHQQVLGNLIQVLSDIFLERAVSYSAVTARFETYRRFIFPEPAEAIVAPGGYKRYRPGYYRAERTTLRAGFTGCAPHHIALKHAMFLHLERLPRA